MHKPARPPSHTFALLGMLFIWLWVAAALVLHVPLFPPIVFLGLGLTVMWIVVAESKS